MKSSVASIKNPEIFKVFDASTGHITKKDDELLKGFDDDPMHPCIIYSYAEGYFIFVFYDKDSLSEKKEELKEFGFSQEFVNLFEIASKAGCKFLNLDCDGPAYSDIPTFTW